MAFVTILAPSLRVWNPFSFGFLIFLIWFAIKSAFDWLNFNLLSLLFWLLSYYLWWIHRRAVIGADFDFDFLINLLLLRNILFGWKEPNESLSELVNGLIIEFLLGLLFNGEVSQVLEELIKFFFVLKIHFYFLIIFQSFAFIYKFEPTKFFIYLYYIIFCVQYFDFI